MKPEWNENTYSKQFDGRLQRSPKVRPVPVTINVRMMTDETAHEVSGYVSQAVGAPLYVFDCGEDLPRHPTLRALGRHYFTW